MPPIDRARSISGLVAGVMLVLSGGAHSLLGWPQLRSPLEATGAPPDLVRGLALGWHFGGVCMLTFGYIAITTFAKAFRGQPVSMATTLLIAIVYLAFGAWALTISGDPFFMVFILPGLLLAFASYRAA